MKECKCFEEIKERASGLILEKIGDHTEFKATWKNSVFFFGENPPKIPVVIPLEFSYRSIKTNGEPYKSKTTNNTSIVMSFCPFCGKSTKEPEEVIKP